MLLDALLVLGGTILFGLDVKKLITILNTKINPPTPPPFHRKDPPYFTINPPLMFTIPQFDKEGSYDATVGDYNGYTFSVTMYVQTFFQPSKSEYIYETTVTDWVVTDKNGHQSTFQPITPTCNGNVKGYTNGNNTITYNGGKYQSGAPNAFIYLVPVS